MAFDLTVGETIESPTIVGGIDFRELPTLARLRKRVDSFFLNRISNIHDDQSFSVSKVNQALDHLLPLLTEEYPSDEKDLLHKLISVLAYARQKGQSLHGVSD
jgi:hypothetical protein